MKGLLPKRDRTALREVAAFSVVELLVVIVLIAIMAALLLPALDKAKEQSKAAACLNNEKQLAAALHMYAEDNADRIVQMADYDTGDDIYPAGGFWGGPVPGVSEWSNQAAAFAAVVTGLQTTNALYSYCENISAYHCPADPRLQRIPAPNKPNGWAFDSYSRTQNTGGEPYDDFWGAGATYMKMTEILRPSETFAMMESADWRGYNVGTWVVQWKERTFEWVDPPSFWHLNVSSSGFADGHGELHKWADPAILAAGHAAALGLNASDWTGPTNGPDYQFVDSHYLFPGHP